MRLGLIGGTVLYGQKIFDQAERVELTTPFGPALVLLTDQVAYLPRHGLDPDRYILPHRINHQANLMALKELGVRDVIGVNSSGSLRKSIGPGSLIVPQDFISFFDVPTVVQDRARHITPLLSTRIRNLLLGAAKAANIPVIDGGVYWESRGPRLETKAEVSFICHVAEIVGMTLGGEATVAMELDLEYASICSVDNYGHGLTNTPLTEEEIRESAQANSQRMMTIFRAALALWEGRTPETDPA